MVQITISRIIDAPADVVFSTVADIRQFSKAIPHIVDFEITSDEKSGVGTQFCEVRLMRGKETSTALEITEYNLNERVRIVTDSHGTVWDTIFSVKPANGKTELVITMSAKAHKLFPKMINPLVKGIIKKAIAIDMDFVKEFCENSTFFP